MSAVTAVLCAMLGIYFSIRSIAALYRIIDLWYTIRTAYLDVIRGLLVWVGGSTAIGIGLPGHYRLAFLIALAGYLVFYVLLFVGTNAAVSRIVRRKLRLSAGDH